MHPAACHARITVGTIPPARRRRRNSGSGGPRRATPTPHQEDAAAPARRPGPMQIRQGGRFPSRSPLYRLRATRKPAPGASTDHRRGEPASSWGRAGPCANWHGARLPIGTRTDAPPRSRRCGEPRPGPGETRPVGVSSHARPAGAPQSRRPAGLDGPAGPVIGPPGVPLRALPPGRCPPLSGRWTAQAEGSRIVKRPPVPGSAWTSPPAARARRRARGRPRPAPPAGLDEP